MRVGRLALLGTLALALTAFVVPAMASASGFRHYEQPIAEGGESETYAGWFEVNNYFRCDNVSAGVDFESEAASIGSFSMQDCQTVGTLAGAGCQIKNNTVEALGLSWQLMTRPTNLTIRYASFKLLLAAGCGLPGFGGGGTKWLSGGEFFGPTLSGEEIGESIYSLANLNVGGVVEDNLGPAETLGELHAANQEEPFEYEY